MEAIAPFQPNKAGCCELATPGLRPQAVWPGENSNRIIRLDTVSEVGLGRIVLLWLDLGFATSPQNCRNTCHLRLA